jgi:hypothetical protein
MDFGAILIGSKPENQSAAIRIDRGLVSGNSIGFAHFAPQHGQVRLSGKVEKIRVLFVCLKIRCRIWRHSILSKGTKAKRRDQD